MSGSIDNLLLVYTSSQFLPSWFVCVVTSQSEGLKGACYSHQESNLFHFPALDLQVRSRDVGDASYLVYKHRAPKRFCFFFFKLKSEITV